ncbi:tail fiber domain-containing protein [Spartinivicinus ruber]|uniref:tail fiber domain-containing protein n=1 Tax=Spartinivicinus ruber TaxID=2683272 RepID=UPI0013D3DCEB|nr:tail fiber domain-containing protein [Spartinivicinus ruber]
MLNANNWPQQPNNDLRIDTAWRENYSGATINRKLAGVLPAGIYSGFHVTIDQSAPFQVLVGDTTAESIAVIETQGYSLTARMPAGMQKALTITPGETLHVVLAVDYQLNQVSTVELMVTPTLTPNSVVLATLQVPSDAEALTPTMLDVSRRIVRIPVLTHEQKANPHPQYQLVANMPHIIDQLTVDQADACLSARQGKKLHELIKNLPPTIDHLRSQSATDTLSANQGRILKEMIDTINAFLSSDGDEIESLKNIVEYIKQNKENLQNLGIDHIAGLRDALNTKLDKARFEQLAIPDVAKLTAVLDSKADDESVYKKTGGPLSGPVHFDIIRSGTSHGINWTGLTDKFSIHVREIAGSEYRCGLFFQAGDDPNDTFIFEHYNDTQPKQILVMDHNVATMDVNFTCNGAIYAKGDVTAFSDRRLKQHINPISAPLKKLKQLGGYHYQRTDTGNYQVGLIAQEVQQVLPDSVKTTPDGYLSINNTGVVALLVEAVKALSNKVSVLEEQLHGS